MMEDAQESKEHGNDLERLIQTPYNDSHVFSEKEKTILELSDAAEELRLEQSLLEAQSHGSQPQDAFP